MLYFFTSYQPAVSYRPLVDVGPILESSWDGKKLRLLVDISYFLRNENTPFKVGNKCVRKDMIFSQRRLILTPGLTHSIGLSSKSFWGMLDTPGRSRLLREKYFSSSSNKASGHCLRRFFSSFTRVL